MRKVKAVLATAVVAAALVIVPATPASATDYGIDMNLVCKHEVSSLAYAVLYAPNNVMSWRCILGSIAYGIDLELWCNFKYGINAHAIYYNFNDAYSWRCRV